MTWLEDLGAVLVAAGVGVINTNIFFTTKAAIPEGVGPYLQINQTGGSGHENTHNEAPLPSIIFPGAQVLVRASSPPAAMTMAMGAYRAIASIQNEMLGGIWYRKVRPVQVPQDMGLDDTQRRIVYGFNVLGERALD